MFFSSIKGMNKLISKGMPNIYLKVANEKNWRSQNFDFLSSKTLSPGQFLGSSNSRRNYLILKILVVTKDQRSGSKTICSFSIILVLEGIMTF